MTSNDITMALAEKDGNGSLGKIIPADRDGVGSIADFSLVENTAMNYYFDG